jgi:tetratricopeptide (TPR) repeat protein
MSGYLVGSLCGFFEPWGTPAFGGSLDNGINKGTQAYQKGEYDEAIKYFSKALQLDPKSDKALFERGLTYYKLGRWEDARSDFMKFTHIKPTAHQGFFYIGMTYFGQKDYSNALPQFDKAIAIEKRPEYYLNAARAALNNGYSGTAIRYCKDAFELYPEKSKDKNFKEVMNQARELINAEMKEEADKKTRATSMPDAYPSN